MDRASRFIWDLSCGERDRVLFEQAMHTLAQVVQQTNDLTLVTDGERRYGLVLFEICQAVHPNTTSSIADHDIHANHVEAFNAALRRRMACYRRKTNTYAKKRAAPMSA